MNTLENFNLQCPLPITEYPQVLMAHGGGGRLMQQLINSVFRQAFQNPFLDQQHDSTQLEINKAKLAFTTDSYVVKPLFFPGGDIGSLAVNGTINDLSMSGACPLYLSAGFIIEEGFPMDSLWRICQSMQQAAETAGVYITTGDTKVVDKGKGDGVYINTSGIGSIVSSNPVHPSSIQQGDCILVNGDLGRHGIAIMAEREGLAFESQIESDCAPLWEPIREMLASGIEIHCMRDLTRGGLSSALNEIATAGQMEITIDEQTLTIREDVRGACEILGLDPLYVANEGRFITFVKEDQAGQALSILQKYPDMACASLIGKVKNINQTGTVTIKTQLGIERILDMLSGEQLPRIC